MATKRGLKITVGATKKTSKASVISATELAARKEENEYFQTNFQLAMSLLPFIPSREKDAAKKWIDKLLKMGGTKEERLIRNDYMWFLLVQIENGAVTLPYIKEPPQEKLKPIAKAIDRKLYQEILQAANNRISLTDSDLEPARREISEVAENVKFCRPSEFLSMLPAPKRGFIAYGSCFSNQYEQ